MKMRSLLLASMMLGLSLNAADRAAFCPAADLPSLAAQCVFNASTTPEVVQGAVDGAIETLVTASETGKGDMCNDTMIAHAFGMLQGALEYAQATGNEYLGEYVQQGLAMVQEHYEANPVLTVAAGAVVVVAAAYVLRGCARLMKKGFVACKRCLCRRTRRTVVRGFGDDGDAEPRVISRRNRAFRATDGDDA